jgi:hypothetical protein
VRSVTQRNIAKATVAGLRNGLTNGRFAHLPTPIKHPPWRERVQTITDGLLADLGGEDEVSFAERILIERVSVLVLQLEIMESQWGERNDGVATPDQLWVFNRCLSSLGQITKLLADGLARRAKTVHAIPTIEAYLKSKKQHAPEAEDDAAEAAE